MTPAWPNRPARSPRSPAQHRPSGGEAGRPIGPGPHAASFTSTPRASCSPRQPASPKILPASPPCRATVSGSSPVATNLRADHPQLLTAILPHEVTHVVLADLFTLQQIPRWADEGMAVLAEPRGRSRAPRSPSSMNRSAPVASSTSASSWRWTIPEPTTGRLYYAQSVSLDQVPGRAGYPGAVRPVRAGHARQGNRAALSARVPDQRFRRAPRALARARESAAPHRSTRCGENADARAITGRREMTAAPP